MSMLDPFKNMANDYKRGYDEADRFVNGENYSLKMFIVLAIFIALLLYGIQYLTGIPVFDWFITVLKWIGEGLLYLLEKIAKWIG